MVVELKHRPSKLIQSELYLENKKKQTYEPAYYGLNCLTYSVSYTYSSQLFRCLEDSGPIAGLRDVITVAKVAPSTSKSKIRDEINLEGAGGRNLKGLHSFSSFSISF